MPKRTKKETVKDIAVRRTAWDHAVEMVVPIIEDHGLEEYKVNYPGSTIFHTSNSSMTKVDQNVDHIIHVAEWLLEPIV